VIGVESESMLDGVSVDERGMGIVVGDGVVSVGGHEDEVDMYVVNEDVDEEVEGGDSSVYMSDWVA
jgi:hypothetical protein